jgi:hypothetical protein
MEWAWFAPSKEIELMGETGRPVSIFSHRAIELMSLDRLFSIKPEYDSVLDEVREWGVFCWMHREPLDEVKEAIYTGAWRSVYDSFEPWDGMEAILPGIRAERGRVAELVADADFDIRPRKSARGDRGSKSSESTRETRPADEVSPDWFSIKVSALMSELRIYDVDALWEVPFWHVMPVIHNYVTGAYSVWTVAPRRSSAELPDESDFESMGSDFLTSDTDERR